MFDERSDSTLVRTSHQRECRLSLNARIRMAGAAARRIAATTLFCLSAVISGINAAQASQENGYASAGEALVDVCVDPLNAGLPPDTTGSEQMTAAQIDRLGLPGVQNAYALFADGVPFVFVASPNDRLCDVLALHPFGQEGAKTIWTDVLATSALGWRVSHDLETRDTTAAPWTKRTSAASTAVTENGFLQLGFQYLDSQTENTGLLMFSAAVVPTSRQACKLFPEECD